MGSTVLRTKGNGIPLESLCHFSKLSIHLVHQPVPGFEPLVCTASTMMFPKAARSPMCERQCNVHHYQFQKMALPRDGSAIPKNESKKMLVRQVSGLCPSSH